MSRAAQDALTTIAIALLAVAAGLVGVLTPHIEADTIGLADGTRAALQCLQSGQRPCPGITAYSLQQTILATAATWCGASSATTARLLSVCSALSVGLLAALAHWLPARRRGLWVGLVAAGPLLFYAASSFGEALATLSLVVFVAVVTRNQVPSRAGLVAITATATWAGLGKDTMPAVVAALGLAAVYLDPRRPPSGWWRLGATAVGVALAAVLFASFHWFRLGEFYNAEYVDHPEFFLSSPRDVASAFLGHWFSPSAGLIWFWPLGAAVLVRSGRHGLAGAVVIAMYAAGLARWWSPFGWVAWGDRLLYPLVAATAYLCLAVRPRHVHVPWWVWGASTVAALAAIAVSQDSTVLAVFFSPDAAFPGPPTIQADVELYRAFLRHLTWERVFRVDLMFMGLRSPVGMVAAALMVCSAVFAASVSHTGGSADERSESGAHSDAI